MRPLTPNRSETRGLPFNRRISTAWISFLARDRERTSCSRRASRRRITRQRSSGIHTASSSPAHNNLASVRASRRSVFARAWRIVPSGLTSDHPAHMPLEDPGDLATPRRSPPRPPDPAARGCGQTAQARPATLDAPPTAPPPPRRSRPRRNRDARLTRSLYRPTCSRQPHFASITRENQRANDNDRYVLTAQPGQTPQGRQKRRARARSASSKAACPTTFSQKAPSPGHLTVRSEPDSNLPSTIFMPRHAVGPHRC